MDVTKKVCSDCKQEKPATTKYFPKHYGIGQRLFCRCKICASLIQKAKRRDIKAREFVIV